MLIFPGFEVNRKRGRKSLAERASRQTGKVLKRQTGNDDTLAGDLKRVTRCVEMRKVASKDRFLSARVRRRTLKRGSAVGNTAAGSEEVRFDSFESQAQAEHAGWEANWAASRLVTAKGRPKTTGEITSAPSHPGLAMDLRLG